MFHLQLTMSTEEKAIASGHVFLSETDLRFHVNKTISSPPPLPCVYPVGFSFLQECSPKPFGRRCLVLTLSAGTEAMSADSLLS